MPDTTRLRDLINPANGLIIKQRYLTDEEVRNSNASAGADGVHWRTSKQYYAIYYETTRNVSIFAFDSKGERADYIKKNQWRMSDSIHPIRASHQMVRKAHKAGWFNNKFHGARTCKSIFVIDKWTFSHE